MFEQGLMDNELNLIERYRLSDGLPHRMVDESIPPNEWRSLREEAALKNSYRAEVYKPDKYGRLKWQSIALGNDYIPIYLAFLDSLDR